MRKAILVLVLASLGCVPEAVVPSAGGEQAGSSGSTGGASGGSGGSGGSATGVSRASGGAGGSGDSVSASDGGSSGSSSGGTTTTAAGGGAGEGSGGSAGGSAGGSSGGRAGGSGGGSGGSGGAGGTSAGGAGGSGGGAGGSTPDAGRDLRAPADTRGVGDDATGGSDNTSLPSYKNDIAPLMTANCTSCHGGTRPNAGISLDTYTNTQKNALTANAMIQSGAMPPGIPLTAEEKSMFQAWCDAGMPNN